MPKKLTLAEQEMLWGGDGPYSEVQSIINIRILDDKIARHMVEVQAHINPTTFKIVKKYRDQFLDDAALINVLDHARYKGKEYGYVVNVQCGEKSPATIAHGADLSVGLTHVILKMHEIVMMYMGEKGKA